MNLRPKRRPVPIIPIVSLIDIMVILLIFFIATTTFRRQSQHLQINLPESQSLGTASSAADKRLAVSISRDKEIFLDGAPVKPENLAAALKALRAAKPGAKLELEADTETPLGILIKVWDSLREAGYSIQEVPARIRKAAAAAADA